jgi:hypothetical protein
VSNKITWVTNRPPTENDVDYLDRILIQDFVQGTKQKNRSITLKAYFENLKEGHPWAVTKSRRKLRPFQLSMAEHVKTEQCGSCRFYRNGECRRCAPSPDWGGSWPQPMDNDWCGEWEARQ